jgi:Transposase IS4
MTQKHHQEEISGPLDTIEAAQLVKDLPKPKRARIQSRKARENQAQSRPFEVLSLRPATVPTVQSISVPKPATSDLSSTKGNFDSTSKQQQCSNSQNSSKRTNSKAQKSQKKAEWEIQLESARSRPERLEILRKVIGPNRPYPEKLNVPTPSVPGRPLLQAHEYKPIDLFHRFIPKELFTDIATHTNNYAFEQRFGKFKEFDQKQREWTNVTAADIGGYFGAVLLIGAQLGGRDIAYYWNQADNYPNWPVAEYISLCRFQQITRYLKINRPGDLSDDQWYKKVEPVATEFRKATTEEMYQLPQNLSIDEQLIKFKGRSKHTIQMNSKAAGEGYKIYSLCYSNGYMVDFKFSSAVEKVAELEHYDGFSSSESVVLDLASSLIERFPRVQPFYVLHLDNFFTTRKLYQRLYELGIGANGTAKAGSGIPKELAYLRDTMTKEKDHGEWFNYVVGSVNCIAFCDSASKAMMTTVHDPTVEDYTYFDAAKRPGASLKYSKQVESTKSTSSTQAGESTESESTETDQKRQSRKLRKLYALDTYNQNMGGSDNHAKQNSYYSTAQHHHLRDWLPLIYLLIDAAVTNSYILYKLGFKGLKKLTHVDFQEEIARSLLRDAGAILRQRRPRPPNASCDPNTKPVRKGTDQGHAWGKLDTYRRCRVCHPPQKPGPKKRDRNALQELSVNAPNNKKSSGKAVHRTVHECIKCSIPICRNSHCWDRHLPNP